MALVTETNTLDGLAGFTTIGSSYIWDSGYIGHLNINGNPNDDYDLTYNLAGTNWYIDRMRFRTDTNSDMDVTITDVAGAGREIRMLDLGVDAGSFDIDIVDTRVRYIRGGEAGVDIDISLGSQRTTNIELYDSNNTIAIGSGGAGSIELGGGRDNVTVDGGDVQSIVTGGMRDTVSFQNGAFGGWVDVSSGNNLVKVQGSGSGVVSVGARSGNDKLVVSQGGWVTQAALGDGANTVTVASGGRMSSLKLGDGDDAVNIQGSGRINLIDLGAGTNTLVTGNQFTEFVKSYNGDNTVTIGSGGAGNILLSGDGRAQTQNITANGSINSINVYDNSSTMLTLNDGAGTVRLSDGADTVVVNAASSPGDGWVELLSTRGGNDTITVGDDGGGIIRSGDGNDVISATGYVELINAGDGDDIINLDGTEGAGWLRGGNGDDLFNIAEMASDRGVRLQGGSGTDTADFGGFTSRLTISLDGLGEWQNIAAPGGNINGVGKGFVRFSQIENLVGGTRSDFLEGSSGANRLTGGRGRDEIFGLEGRDVLIGGRGNDTLTGGADIDTFIFRNGDGDDVITDFEVGTDRLRIVGANDLGDIGFAQNGSDVLLTFRNIEILVENSTIAQLQVDEVFGF